MSANFQITLDVKISTVKELNLREFPKLQKAMMNYFSYPSILDFHKMCAKFFKSFEYWTYSEATDETGYYSLMFKEEILESGCRDKSVSLEDFERQCFRVFANHFEKNFRSLRQ